MELFVVLLGITIIFLITQFIELGRKEEYSTRSLLCGFATFALIVLEILCIDEIVSEPRPKAMDVYQGKTTIEYTIRDGVKVDSVVVFKEKQIKEK